MRGFFVGQALGLRRPLRPPLLVAAMLLCGAANLGRGRLLAGSGRLKGGCGQNCPPSSYFVIPTCVNSQAYSNAWSFMRS